jgi:hypothetical protein
MRNMKGAAQQALPLQRLQQLLQPPWWLHNGGSSCSSTLHCLLQSQRCWAS